MEQKEMAAILAEQLARYRTWGHDRLVDEILRTRREHGCLGTAGGAASDGTNYFVEVGVYWDDKRRGASPDLIDSFIMGPDGRFVDEGDTSDQRKSLAQVIS